MTCDLFWVSALATSATCTQLSFWWSHFAPAPTTFIVRSSEIKKWHISWLRIFNDEFLKLVSYLAFENQFLPHTIQKRDGQKTSEILLLNNRRTLANMCPIEKRHFLTWINLNPGFGRNWDTFLKTSANVTFKALPMKVFRHKKFKFHAGNQKCQIGNF